MSAMASPSTDSGGGGGSFNPDGLPEVDDGAKVRAAASAVKAAIDAIGTTVSVAQIQWQSLTGSYTAPETAELVAVMNKPASVADDLVADAAAAHDALGTYADKLVELAKRRAALYTDMVTLNGEWANWQVRKANATVEYIPDMSGTEGSGIAAEVYSDPTLDADGAALQKRDGQVMQAAAQFASDVAAADIECYNAIAALFGGQRYSLGGTSSDFDHQYGGLPDAYIDAARRGNSPWGQPQSWTDGTLNTGRIRQAEQFANAAGGLAGSLWNLVNFRNDTTGAATRAAFGQNIADIGTVASLPMWILENDKAKASAGRVASGLGDTVAWGKWGDDPNGAMGDVAFGLVLALTTKGAGRGAGAFVRSTAVTGMREAAIARVGVGLESMSTKLANVKIPIGVPGRLAPDLAPVGPALKGAGDANPFTRPAASLNQLSDYILRRSVQVNGVSHTYSGRRLGRNLESVRGEPSPGPGYEAHHIVPPGMTAARPAVEKLIKLGIDLDDAANGTWLPHPGKGATNTGGRVTHPATMTQAYARWVNSRFMTVQTEAEARLVLASIRRILERGEAPWIP